MVSSISFKSRIFTSFCHNLLIIEVNMMEVEKNFLILYTSLFQTG